MASTAFEWCECLRATSPGLGTFPAEIGVVGLVGGRGEGRGKDDVLSLASNDFISRADGLPVPTGVLDLPGGIMTGGGRVAVRVGFGEDSLDPLGSGALKVRPASLARRDRVFAAVTVRALAGLTFSLLSVVGSVIGCGLRACATAKGPAQRGIMGSATLARTKLESTVTGRTFSLIFSWRAVSASPNTMC